MLKISEIRNRRILLDSNIPILYASEGFIERSGNPLRVLLDNANKLAITPISGFEILQGEHQKEIADKYKKILNFVPNVEMEQVYFQNATLLASEYRRICNNKKVPALDLIIAGVVMAASFEKDKLLLMTTDRNDFCEPLWHTVASQIVLDKNSEKVQATLYLLEFNTEVISIV